MKNPLQIHSQQNWQAQLSDTINRLDELLQILQLPNLVTEAYQPKQNNFPLRVPRSFVNKMQVGNPKDPLLLQVLPDKRSLQKVAGFVADPLAENQHNPQQGVIHKYKSRVLVTVTGACAIHCRYCFRQHFDYQSNTPKSHQVDTVIDYIKQQPAVNEVILSGGDPLNLSNKHLFHWLSKLANLPQITTIRIHTRFPIVIPERLEPELLSFLADMCNDPKLAKIVMVVHCNHANEIDDNTASHLLKLRQTGVTLLNQAVLLKNVNDDVTTQVNLNQRVFDAGVLPYYLFVLDKVDGASYFYHSDEFVTHLYWQMLSELPGYLVPKLAREEPNKSCKMPINIYKNVHNSQKDTVLSHFQ